MQRFQNYILGQWEDGQGVETPLFNAITGAQIGEVSSAGLDFSAVLAYGREKGISLRRMTFQERGRMLKALALYLEVLSSVGAHRSHESRFLDRH